MSELTPELVATLPSRSSAARGRVRTHQTGAGLGLAIVDEHRPRARRAPSPSPPGWRRALRHGAAPRTAGTVPRLRAGDGPRPVRERSGRTAAPRRRRRAPCTLEDSGISRQAPCRSPSGSETTSRASSDTPCSTGLSGYWRAQRRHVGALEQRARPALAGVAEGPGGVAVGGGHRHLHRERRRRGCGRPPRPARPRAPRRRAGRRAARSSARGRRTSRSRWSPRCRRTGPGRPPSPGRASSRGSRAR